MIYFDSSLEAQFRFYHGDCGVNFCFPQYSVEYALNELWPYHINPAYKQRCSVLRSLCCLFPFMFCVCTVLMQINNMYTPTTRVHCKTL